MSIIHWFGRVTQTRGNLKASIAQRKQPGQLGQSHGFNDPYYRFRSLAEVQKAAALGIQLDVNRATVDDWLRLPGLSIHQARSLVALSRAGVQFNCLEDLAAAVNLPITVWRSLEPILQFCYYEVDDTIEIKTVPVNTASIERLLMIPVIDQALAAAIVQHRQSGHYRNLIDLQQRLNLPGALIAELMHYLQF